MDESTPQAETQGGATAATAAPGADKTIIKPNASRAALLGAKGGHFDRTNAKRAGAIEVVVGDGNTGVRVTPSLREKELEERLAALEKQVTDRDAKVERLEKQVSGGRGGLLAPPVEVG